MEIEAKQVYTGIAFHSWRQLLASKAMKFDAEFIQDEYTNGH